MRGWRVDSVLLFVVALILPLLVTQPLLAVPLPARVPQKPFTQDQVHAMVRDGVGDELGAKLIVQRGIDFTPSADFLQTLKSAGASEAFLQAVRAAVTPGWRPAPAVLKGGSTAAGPPSAGHPLNQVQILALLAAEVPKHRIAMLVEEHGVDFDVSDDYLQQVRLGGGDDELINALKNARVMKPLTVDPAAAERQAELQRHVARGAELLQRRDYPAAEVEYRAAILVEPQNADLHVALSRCLTGQGHASAALVEAREALRLNPESDLGHYGVGNALRAEGDTDGAIAEFRLALRLNPNSELAHNGLGFVFVRQGNLARAIFEYREALRSNPNFDVAHSNLGFALTRKNDWDGALDEFHAALRLNPYSDVAHIGLGDAFGHQGDWDGAIGEYHEALRLNPHSATAHNQLGIALHRKADLRGALEEFRTASSLQPNNLTYKQNYERLLREVNK